MSNTIAYFDITIANEPAGRLTFELFDDVVPKVCLFMHLWPPCLLPQESVAVGREIGANIWLSWIPRLLTIRFCRLPTTLSTSVSETRPTKPALSSRMPGLASTGASRASCCKVVTLPGATEPVESPSMARRLVESSVLLQRF